jgi:cell division protein FtsI (penicillin-binding protein 3)
VKRVTQESRKTETRAHDWRTTLRSRLGVAAAMLLLWSAAIEARLVFLQVVRHADLAARAERQQMRTLASPAKRGEILDRKGHVLAYSVDADTIYADPGEIADPAKTADALCAALENCSRDEKQDLRERLGKKKSFAYVRRQVSPDEARRVAALQLEGIGFLKENRRFYPNKELASHVLGYVGLDNGGLSGIEATYDSLIKGAPGAVLVQTDAKRQAFSRVERPATAGASLELTIDEYLQHVVERELKAGVEENRAAGASAIVMDPWTGEILAMANYPTFNPNAYRQAGERERRNRAIQDLYEPGSTFKVVTASAALEQKVVTPTDLINVSGGSIRLGSSVVHDTHDYGVLSFTDVIVKSSNVGAIKVGLKVGADHMSEYVKRFGFGRRASPDFPGETPGIVWNFARIPEAGVQRALASMSMGYQIGVTPLQMATAVSSVANGGQLFEPRVVRAVIRDGQRIPVPSKVINRTITGEVAAELTAIMEDVVERGTATTAQLPGYTVAGKTGTAAKLVAGHYSKSDYNASFVGFVPSRKPVFTIIVVTDSAHGPHGSFGGPVSGPVFKRIADAALRYYGVPPTINPSPPILVARRDEAHEQPASAVLDTPAIVTAVAATGPSTIPDVTGMGARDALRLFARVGLAPRLRGTGVVSQQDPPPGSPIDPDATATLWLERQSSLRLASAPRP